VAQTTITVLANKDNSECSSLYVRFTVPSQFISQCSNKVEFISMGKAQMRIAEALCFSFKLLVPHSPRYA